MLANKYNVVTGVEQVPFTPKDYSNGGSVRLPLGCTEGSTCAVTAKWLAEGTDVHFRVRVRVCVRVCVRLCVCVRVYVRGQILERVCVCVCGLAGVCEVGARVGRDWILGYGEHGAWVVVLV